MHIADDFDDIRRELRRLERERGKMRCQWRRLTDTEAMEKASRWGCDACGAIEGEGCPDMPPGHDYAERRAVEKAWAEQHQVKPKATCSMCGAGPDDPCPYGPASGCPQ